MKQREPHLVEINLGESKKSSDGYDALYLDGGLSQISSFYLWLMDQLPLPKEGSLLDISCGSGEVLQLAASRGLHPIGIEISKVAARIAALNTSSETHIGIGAGEALPLKDHSFDIVTNIGSLEHFVDPDQGLQEMRRVLKDDGFAAILVPNTFSLLSNIWSVFRKGQIAIDNQPIQRYGTYADWVLLLQANGLLIQETKKYERSWPRSLHDWGYYLRNPKDLIRLMISPIIPKNLAYAFLFICRPLS